MSRDEEVEIAIDKVVRDVPEKDNAMLVEKDGREVWVPYSQISKVTREGANVTLRMSTWIAKQKDFV